MFRELRTGTGPVSPQDRRRALRRFREVNARRIAELDLPSPCDLTVLHGQLGVQRNRPIRLVPMPIPASQPCGMWAALPDEDLIFYDSRTTNIHQEHIILHELGHVICQHRGGDLVGGDTLSRLFPHLSAELVQSTLLRAEYDNADEQEAEILAYLLRERMHGLATTDQARPPDEEDALSRVQRTLR
jgi:hypothetical protein